MTAAAIVGLRAIHEDLQSVFDRVTDAEWGLDSACAGWRVQDVLAHFTSNFNEMVNPSPPPDEPVEMTAEQAMEALVAPRKSWSPAQLLAEYAAARDGAFGALTAMQDEPLGSTVIPIADLGSYPMHLLANAYCFDHYCHLRHDLLAPGGPLGHEVPPADDLRLRPGIEWMIAGLPQMCKAGLAVLDRPLVLELTGAGGGSWTLNPAGDDGLVTAVENGGGGVATASSSAHDFVSWGTGRSAWRNAVTLSGDTDYAAAVLDGIQII